MVDKSTRDKALAIFAQHGGVLRTQQALALGIHPRTLYALRDTGALPGSYDSSPIVGLRGDVIDLPMYLGCDLYDGRWRWTRGRARLPLKVRGRHQYRPASVLWSSLPAPCR